MPGVGQSGEVKRALNAHSGWVNAVAWSHCGKWLASGGDDKMVYIYDAQTFEVKCPVRGHNGEAPCICGGYKGMIRNPECPVTGHSAPVSSVAFSADGQWVMSGSSDKTIRLWDTHAAAQ